jgi:tetratricopeptide (TPR) repeat protein
MGHYDEALLRSKQALGMNQKIYGDIHPAVALSLTSMGLILKSLGNYDAAQESHENALEIFKIVYGADKTHPDVASSLDNIAVVLNSKGHYNQAWEKSERALAMRKQVYGEKRAHPDTAASLSTQGLILESSGNYQQAFGSSICYEEVPDTTASQLVLESSANYQQAFDPSVYYKQALDWYGQSLAISQKLYSTNPHPDKAQSLYDIAHIHYLLGNYDEALRSANDALAMEQELSKPSASPAMRECIKKTANLIADIDKARAAHPLRHLRVLRTDDMIKPKKSPEKQG